MWCHSPRRDGSYGRGCLWTQPNHQPVQAAHAVPLRCTLRWNGCGKVCRCLTGTPRCFIEQRLVAEDKRCCRYMNLCSASGSVRAEAPCSMKDGVHLGKYTTTCDTGCTATYTSRHIQLRSYQKRQICARQAQIWAGGSTQVSLSYVYFVSTQGTVRTRLQ